MKQNKEIKKGDKIWWFTTHTGEDSFFTVKSVKKVKTLVEIVVTISIFDKEREYVMYGHSSSSMLSGYNRIFGRRDDIFTCDYGLIREGKERYDRNERFMEAGRALLYITKFFK